MCNVYIYIYILSKIDSLLYDKKKNTQLKLKKK
jgi:hypothetical protein